MGTSTDSRRWLPGALGSRRRTDPEQVGCSACSVWSVGSWKNR